MSLDRPKRSFYRVANSIFGRVGRVASEEVHRTKWIQYRTIVLLTELVRRCNWSARYIAHVLCDSFAAYRLRCTLMCFDYWLFDCNACALSGDTWATDIDAVAITHVTLTDRHVHGDAFGNAVHYTVGSTHNVTMPSYPNSIINVCHCAQ